MVRTRTTVKPGLLLQSFVLAQLSGSLGETVRGPSGWTSNEYAVASWLNICISATPSELAGDLGMPPTTLSSVIDSLVKKGHVRRVPNPEDGRSYLLQLTAKGKAVNADNASRFEHMVADLRSELELDEQEILATMRSLEEAMRRTLAARTR